MPPEELRKLTVEAMETMLAKHQVLPGNLGQVELGGKIHNDHSRLGGGIII